MKSQSLKIRLNANISSVLDAAAKSIVKLAKKSGCKVSGPVPLPTNICKITVNKSPHVDKKSREQFEVRDLSRLIVIHYPSTELIKNLSSFHLPNGVAFKIISGEEFKIDKKGDEDLSAQSANKKDLDKKSNDGNSSEGHYVNQSKEKSSPKQDKIGIKSNLSDESSHDSVKKNTSENEDDAKNPKK